MAFNIALALCGFLGGWWMKVMHESLKELRTADKELTEKVGKIEVLVAGQYVKREDFDQTARQLFHKLDKIYDKLETKADK